MNTRVLGSEESPGQWVFPKVAKNKRSGGYHLVKKGLTGVNAKKTLLGLHHLVRCTFLPEHDEKSWDGDDVRMANAVREVEWLEMVGCAVPVVQDLEREEDWSDDQIWEYHSNTARLMQCYCDLLPENNITSYIHLIGAAHLTYYLLLHRNLARFQQQGWEQMMKLVHHYCCNNTNHGGSQGNSNGNLKKGEHCHPLMRSFRRRIM